jgi:hypothetical protein
LLQQPFIPLKHSVNHSLKMKTEYLMWLSVRPSMT